jgi:hypothetical protein
LANVALQQHKAAGTRRTSGRLFDLGASWQT